MSDNDSRLKSLVASGSEIAGAAIGGALGFLAGGPTLAAGAGAVGVGVTKVLQDVSSRLLSTSETERVGAAAAVSLSEIKRRMDGGDELRRDDFFNKNQKRSDAEEVFEGALLAAKNSHEEKKAIYLGKLFANVCFDQTCSKEEANFQLNQAQSLTYAQFCLLQIFNQQDNFFGLRVEALGAGAQVHYGTIAYLQATKRLCDLGLSHMKIPGEEHHLFVMEINGIQPAHLELSVSGKRLRDLLGLEEVPVEDLYGAARWLS